MTGKLLYPDDGRTSLFGLDEARGVYSLGPGDTSDCGSDWQGNFGGDAGLLVDDDANLEAGIDGVDEDAALDSDDGFDDEFSDESPDAYATRIDGA